MSAPTPDGAAGGARILDRGYRKFEGRRHGVVGSMRSVAWHTTRSILGLGRPARHKVFPIIVMVVAFIPPVAFVAISILIGDLGEEIRPEYWEFFDLPRVMAVLFAALVAPEAIVRDRRDGMYSLYLSTPLSRPTYLAAKVAAVFGTLSIIVVGPALLALLGYTFQGLGPDGFPAWLWVAARIVLAGAVIGLIYTAIAMAASSLTDRRAFASVAVILVLFGVSIAVGLLVEEGGVGDALRLVDPLRTPLEFPVRLFGDRTYDYRDVSTLSVIGGNLLWLVAGVGVVTARYRKLEAV